MTVAAPSPTPAELRERHSIASAVRSAIVLWYAVVGGILAWTIHLVGLASLVRYTCNAPENRWWLHGLTGLTLAMAGFATWLSYGLLRDGRRAQAVDPSSYDPGGAADAQVSASQEQDRTNEHEAAAGDERTGTPVARTVFLGQLGIAIGVVNILLIALEEVYVVVLQGVGCG